MHSQKQTLILAGLLAVIIALTGSLSASSHRPSGFGAFAPIVVLGVMTWYLVFLLLNRELVTGALASLFSGGGRRNYGRVSILMSVVVYSILIALMVAVFYSGALSGVMNQSRFIIFPNNFTLQPNVPPPDNRSNIIAPEHFSTYAAIIALAIYAASIFLIVQGFIRAARERSSAVESPPEETAEEAGAIVEHALQDLRQERDYHEVIIECYLQMCQILSKARIVIGATDTPREFAEIVGRKMKLGSDAVRGLTFLFEEARYSNHTVTDEQRALAIRTLEFLQRILAADSVITS